MNQLLDRYLEMLDVEPTTRERYESCIRTHIRPLLGELGIGRLSGEVLDSVFATLRRCGTRLQRPQPQDRTPHDPGAPVR